MEIFYTGQATLVLHPQLAQASPASSYVQHETREPHCISSPTPLPEAHNPLSSGWQRGKNTLLCGELSSLPPRESLQQQGSDRGRLSVVLPGRGPSMEPCQGEAPCLPALGHCPCPDPAQLTSPAHILLPSLDTSLWGTSAHLLGHQQECLGRETCCGAAALLSEGVRVHCLLDAAQLGLPM